MVLLDLVGLYLEGRQDLGQKHHNEVGASHVEGCQGSGVLRILPVIFLDFVPAHATYGLGPRIG